MQRLRHPRDRPRGVPHRFHRLPGDRLPRGDRLGGDVEPRARRRDGFADRAGHARPRRPPGPVAPARRRTRLPLGARRGDLRRGSLPRRNPRHRLRQGPPGRGRHGDPQALRRLSGLARRPQPRAGADGPARTRGRHAPFLRDGGPRGRRRLGDELLLRHRRRARRRFSPPPHRGPARALGIHGDDRLGLLVGPIP